MVWFSAHRFDHEINNLKLRNQKTINFSLPGYFVIPLLAALNSDVSPRFNWDLMMDNMGLIMAVNAANYRIRAVLVGLAE